MGLRGTGGNVWRILKYWKDLCIVGAIGDLLKTCKSPLIHSIMGSIFLEDHSVTEFLELHFGWYKEGNQHIINILGWEMLRSKDYGLSQGPNLTCNRSLLHVYNIDIMIHQLVELHRIPSLDIDCKTQSYKIHNNDMVYQVQWPPYHL